LSLLNNDLNRLENQEKNFSQKLLEQKQTEESLIASYEEKRKEIEKAKDETREAEKDIFRIVAKQNEVHAVLDRLKTEERQVFYDEETFKNDLSELSSVGGVEILKFSDEYIDYEQEDRGLQFERKKHLERLKIRLEESGVVGGDDILKEYKDTEDRDEFLAKELIDLEKSKEDTEKLINELSERLDFEFKEGVKKINDEFNNFFTLMFGGGNASLRVLRQEKRRRVSEDDELENIADGQKEVEEGLEVEVSLPHKRIKGLMMLSGGERALTSIALLFAISQVNPPPFVILDETDAALDEANSRKYGDMVGNLAKHSELIVITHNRETMSRAGVLYGVTMGKDATSKLLSISFKEAEEVAK
jgi:chromosome segregation protein